MRGKHMGGKSMTFIECDRILKSLGFVLIRVSGSHNIYGRGVQRFVLPRNMKTVSQKTWQRECKKNNIDPRIGEKK